MSPIKLFKKSQTCVPVGPEIFVPEKSAETHFYTEKQNLCSLNSMTYKGQHTFKKLNGIKRRR